MSTANPTVVFAGPRVVRIEDRPAPSPDPGEVLIRTRRTLISTGTELTILSGEFPRDSHWSRYGRFPFTAGYSNVGEVIGTGPGVDSSHAGRRVMTFRPHASLVKAPVSELIFVPEGVTDEQAAFTAIALIVMNGVRRAGLRWGEAVVVVGLGLLGQLCARFSSLSGGRPVIGLDPAALRRSLLAAVRGIAVADPASEDARARIGELTGGRMADVVFEVTGDPGLIAGEFGYLKPSQGRLVIMSSPRGPSEIDLHDLCNAPSHTIIGAHLMSIPATEDPANPWTKTRNAELFFSLVAAGEVGVDRLVSHRVPPAKAPDLYAELLDDRRGAMGVMLEWD